MPKNLWNIIRFLKFFVLFHFNATIVHSNELSTTIRCHYNDWTIFNFLKSSENHDTDSTCLPKSPQEGSTADSSSSVITFSSIDPTKVAQPSQGERRKKKPYKELTLEEKVQLIRLAEENSSLSQASIAEKYSIAKSNVCRILQRKAEYLRAFESAGFAGSRKRKLRGDVANSSRHYRSQQPQPNKHNQRSLSANPGNNQASGETPEAMAIVRPIARNPLDCGSDSLGVHATPCASASRFFSWKVDLISQAWVLLSNQKINAFFCICTF